MGTDAYVDDVYQLAIALAEDPGLRDVVERRVPLATAATLAAVDVEVYSPVTDLSSLIAAQQVLKLSVDAALVVVEWRAGRGDLSTDLVRDILAEYEDAFVLTDLRYSSFWSKFELNTKIGRERFLALSLLIAGGLHLIALVVPPPAGLVVEAAGILIELAGPTFAMIWPDSQPLATMPVTPSTIDLAALPSGLTIRIYGAGAEYRFAVSGQKLHRTDFARLLQRAAAELRIDTLHAEHRKDSRVMDVRILAPSSIDFSRIENIASATGVSIIQ